MTETAWENALDRQPRAGNDRRLEIPRDWTFRNSAVASAFDRHVREQLPWYELATGAIAHIARHYIPAGGLVYDIGASTGNIGRALADVLAAREARLIPIEASAEMARLYDGPGRDELVIGDACDVAWQPCDLAVLFLVLMFVPVAARRALLDRVRAAIRPGGAMIVVDKLEAGRGYVATVLWRLSLAGKLAAGAVPDEIVAKELSLAGVQRPVDPGLFTGAVEWFRFGEFAGWIVER